MADPKLTTSQITVQARVQPQVSWRLWRSSFFAGRPPRILPERHRSRLFKPVHCFFPKLLCLPTAVRSTPEAIIPKLTFVLGDIVTPWTRNKMWLSKLMESDGRSLQQVTGQGWTLTLIVSVRGDGPWHDGRCANLTSSNSIRCHGPHGILLLGQFAHSLLIHGCCRDPFAILPSHGRVRRLLPSLLFERVCSQICAMIGNTARETSIGTTL